MKISAIVVAVALLAEPAFAQHYSDPGAAQQMGDIIRSQGVPAYRGPVYSPPAQVTIVPSPAQSNPYSHCLNGSPWC